jgi:ribonuclease E
VESAGAAEAEPPTPDAENHVSAPRPTRRWGNASGNGGEQPAAGTEDIPVLSAEDSDESEETGDGTPRRGWWQRTFGA